MNVTEWALVVFTTLAQMSVGSFLVLGFVHFFAARKYSVEEADRLSDRALLVIGPVLVLGLLASLLHLGDPFNAFRAVVNVSDSWLSREILFGVIFAVLGGVFALMQWRKIGTATIRNLIAFLAALVGLALVFSMSHVYMLPTQPAWNTVATPILFFATTLLLGSLAIGAAFVANYAYLKGRTDEGLEVSLQILRGVLRGIATVAIVVLGVQLVVIPLYLASLSNGVAAAMESARMMIEEYGLVFGLRLVLAFLGAGVFGLFLYRSASGKGGERILGNLVYSAFAFVLVAEVLGRFLFYATQAQIGF
jgi:anaerobic dimethyl sulfoxide reductase subunit C (anchor subunit)